MLKSKIYFFITIALIIILLFGWMCMNKRQYRMAVLVTPESENDKEWPSKKNGLTQVRGLNHHSI